MNFNFLSENRAVSKQQVAELVHKVRTLLASEKSWAKGFYARDRDGNQVMDTDSRAIRWCLVGACWKESGIDLEHEGSDSSVAHLTIRFLQHVGRMHFATTQTLSQINDSRTHKEIIDLLDRAIQITEMS